MDHDVDNKGMGRWGLAFGIGMVVLFAGFFTDIGAVLAAGVLILLVAFAAAVFIH